MSADWFQQLEGYIVGHRCEILRREHDWAVNLVGGASIALPVPWRIVQSGRIGFASQDDGHTFSLKSPVDGETEANKIIGARPISGISIDPGTADLVLRFGADVRLDAFISSIGYEGWHISPPPRRGGISVVALGGGELAIF